MSGAVDWDVARTIAAKVAGREPYQAARYRDGLEEDFDRYTAMAEDLVAECTGLRSLAGNARGRVTNRAGWVDANLASFQRLLKPITTKLEEKMDGKESVIGPKFAGAELGAMLGWMSTRVLGQYDLLVIEDERPEEQDIVYYVAPNVLALEKRYAFPPQEFRLWLALHEVTHRAQFTGVPWMREHFLGLVNGTMESVDPDPKRFLAAAQRLLEARRRGEDPMDQGGVMALFASEEQLAVIDEVAGLMSLLEGHGDVTMDRAGKDLIPSQERFARVLRNRRQNSSGFTKVFQRLAGLEAKMKQYAEGEHFIAEVEKAGGVELLDKAWSEPANVPSIGEIRDPSRWIDRVNAPAGAAA
ncbi:MAG: zinc-dependent metalloprotease [Acidimicrobiales bacterium]|nr:zinc-dependent metalloprotease [Acidimicrobiales bacterium]